MAGVACAAAGWAWLTRNRIPDLEVGPIEFSDDVWVRVLRGHPYGLVRARLLVGHEVVATRVRGLPHWLAKFMDMDHTLRASDFELAVTPVGKPTKLASRASLHASRYPIEWEDAVVLRGSDGRGRLELAFFRSRTATQQDVQRALIEAGARPPGGTLVAAAQ